MTAIVVIPTYNEAANVERLVAAIRENAPDLHILFVDDDSPDGTGQIVDTLAEAPTNQGYIFALHRAVKDGFARAYIAGYQWAIARNYDVIVQMDADLSHEPRYLPALIAGTNRADMVVGSRYLNGISVINWPLKRIILSCFANWYVRKVTSLPINDCTSGFRAYKTEVLKALNLESIVSNGYSFQVEMTYRAWLMGRTMIEEPIIFVERRDGQSKMNGKIIREAMLVPLRLRLGKSRLKKDLLSTSTKGK